MASRKERRKRISEVFRSMAGVKNMRERDEPIRVLLVDDHLMIRQVLRNFLTSYYRDIQVVGEAGSGEEAVEAVQMLSPSVVVMDINMPGLNGIEATAIIKQAHPHVRVVGLSMSVEQHYQHAMIVAGATTLISKATCVEQLYDAIITSVSQTQ